MKSPVQLTLIVFLALFAGVHAARMVPFVIPADVNPDSAILMTAAPLGPKDRLSAKDHFFTTDGRQVRLWGVNLSFAANFPTHADAARIAERLAAFGVNAVRCHHMDTAVWPRGIWDASGRALHPEALDRLDYFIDQLARRGIYTDLNLHVGKKYSEDLEIPESAREYDKMTSLFTPELIVAQQDYARRLLTHTNTYRKMTYAEDYAVAIVEITNENSLFMWDAEKTLRTLPAFYADLLQSQYNTWLADQYGTTAKLEAAWNAGLEAPGETNRLGSDKPVDGWRLEQHGQGHATIQNNGDNQPLRIGNISNDGTSWHLQYNHPGLTFEQGRYYTVRLNARAAAERPLTVSVQQAHDPWANLGLSRQITLTPQWQTFTLGFTATQSDDNGRLNLAFGTNDADIEIQSVRLITGGQVGLGQGESLEGSTVAVFGENESERRQLDRMIFMGETEKAYFDRMKAYIKDDLGCNAMVTGTIVFGPLSLYALSDMDFIDGHAYWQHPRFPNRPWDPGDWMIEQEAMSSHPQEATLYQLAAQRLTGKPFTVTEYNHPAPLDSQAECVPMISSFAAAQDWDGVWVYTYSHSNDDWDRERINSYFDIDSNPAKWGFMPAGAVMFRDAGLQPFRNGTVWSLTRDRPDTMDALAVFQMRINRNLAAFLQDMFRANMATRVYTSLDPNLVTQRADSGRLTEKADLIWNVVNGQGLYVMRNDRCCAMTGQTERFAQIQRPVQLRVDRPDFAAVTVTAMDQQPLAASKRILVTACGHVENTDMQFSDDRRTVGRHWGHAPVRIEPLVGTLTLPDGGRETICKLLNPDGTVRRTIPVTGGIVPLKAEYGTMWYLIERK